MGSIDSHDKEYLNMHSIRSSSENGNKEPINLIQYPSSNPMKIIKLTT